MTSLAGLAASDLAALALKTWSADPAAAVYDEGLVASIYAKHLLGGGGPAPRGGARASGAPSVPPRQVLETSSYLEHYLWPFFHAGVSFEHVASMVLMVNQKAKEGLPLWAGFHAPLPHPGGAAAASAPPEKRFQTFITRVLLLRGERPMQVRERNAITSFISHAFLSLEDDWIRKAVLRLTSLPLWLSVAPSRVEVELERYPHLRKPWARVSKDFKTLAAAPLPASLAPVLGDGAVEAEASGAPPAKKRKVEGAAESSAAPPAFPSIVNGRALPVDDAPAMLHLQKRLDASFLPALIGEFLATVEAIPPPPAPVHPGLIRYAERCTALLIDLLAQLPTRRFLRLLLEDLHLLPRLRRSALASARVVAPPPSVYAPGGEAAGNHGHQAHHPAGAAAHVNDGRLYAQLLDVLTFFLDFEVDDQTGTALAETDVASRHALRVQVLQRLAYKHFGSASKDMREFSLLPTGVAAQAKTLEGFLNELSDEQLRGVARRLRLLPPPEEEGGQEAACSDVAAPTPAPAPSAPAAGAGVKRSRAEADQARVSASSSSLDALSAPSGAVVALRPRALLPPPPPDRAFLKQLLLEAHTARQSQLRAINATPLYPTEATLWDPNLVPTDGYGASADAVLALPRLNLQFLTFYDYLFRSFHLYRLESAYAIRSDLVEAVVRLNPRQVLESASASSGSGGGVNSGPPVARTRFTGWSRMALPLLSFAVSEVAPPRVGEDVPARVTAEAGIDLSRHAPALRAEWDALREHDVLFLLTVRCPVPTSSTPEAYWEEVQKAKAAGSVATPVEDDDEEDGGSDGGSVDGGEGGETTKHLGEAHLNAADGPDAAPPAADAKKQHLHKPAASSSQQRGSGGRRLSPADDFDFPAKWGVVAVRGAELVHIKDEAGRVLNEPSAAAAASLSPEAADATRASAGVRRQLVLSLDPAQYHLDTYSGAATSGDSPYATFNVIVRRRPEENNFKAVLATIRDVMNDAAGAAVAAAAAAVAGGDDASSPAGGGAVATSALARTLPPWLHDVFLGYGDAAAAHYRSFPAAAQANDVDFKDTFLDAGHLVSSFPGRAVVFRDEETGATLASVDGGGDRASATAALGDAAAALRPPFRVLFETDAGAPGGERVVALPYEPLRAGPYPEDVPKANAVAFTPVQVEAIRSGVNQGLTLVVGPPGTGKTDTAVQIISNLYHNYPSQRVLLVTQSNQALNDLFEKIMARDIKEHHLLRLGAGERDLDTDKDFSKGGRVQQALGRRIALLAEVDRLGAALGVPGDVGYTCETAQYFYLHHVVSRIEAFRLQFGVPAPPSEAWAAARAVTELREGAPGAVSPAEAAARKRRAYRAAARARMATVAASSVADAFPFPRFFATAPGGLAAIFSPGATSLDALLAAEACFTHLEAIFQELASYAAFELLRSSRSRNDYMLTKQARIVAMTCTHAALTRAHLLELGFQYDTVVMEEAAQVLEIETFIPLVLQGKVPGAGGGHRRLKRVILIGDHHQLPPVVQNRALQQYGRLDQSMFTRLIRLGLPRVQLNAQGRARPSLAALYNWRYEGALGDLPSVIPAPRDAAAGPPFSEYTAANAGFAHEFQLIDVGDFGGRGESTPTAHFYQNLGEAEYLVAVYQYMRLAGYPADRIAMLTTYNGQKELLRDIVRRRCEPFPFFGAPSKIETVDKYQGQQADYVLLSLVRTKAVGHLRDVRRLVVALSRARLGLYVFARASVFSGVYELLPAFKVLGSKPQELQLLVGEAWPAVGRHVEDTGAGGAAAGGGAAGGVIVPVTVRGGPAEMQALVTRIVAAKAGAAGAGVM